MTSLHTLDGVRPAEAGEFSRRAFENGKMDLTALEAIADLVDAETDAQRRQALTQMDGVLARRYDGWRDRLLQSLAFAEASIDFAEEDIPDDLAARSLETVETLIEEIGAHLADNGVGERIRDGFRIALAGPPNAGKSSLLNALAKRDVAIVSDIAGTTRDVLEVPLDLGGYPAILVDTAGIREGGDIIEQEGVRRARDQAAAADVIVDMRDVTDPGTEVVRDPRALLVFNKVDLLGAGIPLPAGGIGISVHSGIGLPDLIAAMSERIRTLAQARAGASAPLTRARHRDAPEHCRSALVDGLREARAHAEAELVAENLRTAAHALGRITGRVDVEMLLDRIFRDFCIGK